MVPDPNGEDRNVFDLAKARRQAETLKSHKKKSGKSQGSDPKKSPKMSGKKGIWHYIQFILFLLMAAYMMHLCTQGGV